MSDLGVTCPSREVIEAAAAGAPDSRGTLVHAQECALCGAVLAEISADIALLDSVKTVVRSGGRSMGLPMSGDTLGGYKILDVIHQGGQGIVYRAHHEATKRDVALKVLLGGGFATKDQVARFRREAELVAHLDHPGIVTIYDSGVDESGQAYLVMELVEGQDLATWVSEEREKRGVREIIELFIGICDAVRHAHQRGVIHRDLKPSNIMINRDDHARVLDFGIAKVMRGDDNPDAEATGVTREGEFVGTFLYASPEQVTSGSAMVDVRTDVYAIGMMLYEALAGRRAYELKGGIAEVVRTIKQAPIDAPSEFDPRVDHEVDTISLKALTKDPARRYETVGALGEDLRRYLHGDPIEAKRDSKAYVFRKIAWKHRISIGIATAFVIVLIGSTIVSTVALIKATNANKASNANTQTIIESIVDTTLGTLVSSDQRVATIEDMLDVQERSYRAAPGIPPKSKAAILRALGVSNLDRGRYEESLGLFESVLAFYEGGIIGDEVAHAEALFDLGRVHWRRAEFELAEGFYERTLAMRRELYGEEHPDVAMTLHHLGSTLTQLGRYAEAESLLKQAFGIREHVLDRDDPEIDSTLNSLVVCLREQSKYREAIERAEELLERLIARNGADDWRVGRMRHNFGMNLADIGEYEGAEKELRAALENKMAWRGAEHIDTARTLCQLARVHLDRWEWEGESIDTGEVIGWCESAIGVQREVLDPLHPDLVGTRVQMIRALLAAGEPHAALEQAQSLLAEQIVSYSAEGRWQVGKTRCLIGLCMGAMGRHQEAVRIAKQGERGVREAPDARDRERWAAMRRVGAVCRAAGDIACAERYLSEAGKVFGERAG